MNEQWPKAILVLFGVAALGVLFTLPFRPSDTAPHPRSRSLSFWVGQLDTKDGQKAQIALRTIGLKAVPLLLAKLRQGDALPAETVGALRALGPDAVPSLVAALDDHCEEVRITAITTIGALRQQIGQQVTTVVPGLARNVSDPSADVRIAAMVVLAGIGPRSAPAIPALIRTLNYDETGSDQTTCVRAKAAHALGRIGPLAQAAVPALTGLLTDPDWYTRQQGALAIWRITHDANQVVPALSEMLVDPDNTVRQSAALTLSQIGVETSFELDLQARIQAAKPHVIRRMARLAPTRSEEP